MWLLLAIVPGPAAWAVDIDRLAGELNETGQRLTPRLQRFFQALQQWTQGMEDSAAVRLVQDTMIPAAQDIRRDFAQISHIGHQLGGSSQEGRMLVTLGNRGFSLFSEWTSLLGRTLELSRSNDTARLEQVATQRLVPAIQGTVAFLQEFAALSAQAGQAAPTAPAPPSPAGSAAGSVSKADLLRLQQEQYNRQQQMQALSNMSRMMHETNMAIINNIGGSSTDYDHYENGAYVGSW
jgi:hypothetical protein